MLNHGQDNYGRDITSEERDGGKRRYHVTSDGVGILFIDVPAETPLWRVLNTINAHAPAEA